MSEQVPPFNFNLEFEDAEPFERYDSLIRKMGHLVGETIDRFTNPDSNLTDLDMITANLTFGQIVGRSGGNYSPSLPEGAKRSHDTAELILMEHHLADVNTYLAKENQNKHEPTMLADYPVWLMEELYGNGSSRDNRVYGTPKVEGYNWRRGFVVDVKDTGDKVLIFAPYMQPWRIGGAPFPILYTIGSPSSVLLTEIAYEYGFGA